MGEYQKHLAKKYDNEKSLIEQVNRPNWTIADYLKEIGDVLGKIDLSKEHELLNVGCGNGLMDIIFTRMVKNATLIDPVEKATDLGRELLKDQSNVKFVCAYAEDYNFEGKMFDRILSVATFSALDNRDKAIDLLRVISALLKPNIGKALITSINDAEKRKEYLDFYIPQVQQAPHLSPEEKKSIIQRNIQANSYDYNELSDIVRDMGGEATQLATGSHNIIKLNHVGYPDVPIYKYKFDLLISK